MVSRRQLREYALQALYQCDSLGDFSAEGIDLYFLHFHSCRFEAEEEDRKSNPFNFARDLCLGVVSSLEDVDAFIGSASDHWSIERMSRVDRNILRIGTFEINFMDDIPPNVTINEGIEIAKRYGSDDSPMFINGVLDRVACDHRARAQRGSGIPLRKVSND